MSGVNFVVLTANDVQVLANFIVTLTYSSYQCADTQCNNVCYLKWMNKEPDYDDGTDGSINDNVASINCPILIVKKQESLSPTNSVRCTNHITIVVKSIPLAISSINSIASFNGLVETVPSKYDDADSCGVCTVRGPDGVGITLIELGIGEKKVTNGIPSAVYKYISFVSRSSDNSNNSSNRNSSSSTDIDSSSGSSSGSSVDTTSSKNNIKKASKQSPTTATSATKTRDVEWACDRGISTPSIAISLLHQGKYLPVNANSITPIPFENDLFMGQCLLLLNTTNLHPDSQANDIYLSRFDGTKYQFEVQIQGKFKAVPTGRIYIGAEITKKMDLGLLTKGFCSSILKLGRSVNEYLHHSYGDRAGLELPHITGPIWSSIDRLVITKDGDALPVLGQVFAEDTISRSVRRKLPDYSVNIDVDSTYSMSFKTSNIDLINWKCANIPFVGSLDLHTFWSDAALRFVFYHIPESYVNSCEMSSSNSGLPKYHPRDQLQYLFNMEINHVSNLSADMQQQHQQLLLQNQEHQKRQRRLSVILNDDDDDDDGDDDGDGDIHGVGSQYPGSDSDDDYYDTENGCEDVSIPTSSAQINATITAKPILHIEEEDYVVAAIDVDEVRSSRKGGRRTLYAFIIDPAAASTSNGDNYVLRSYSEWTDVLCIRDNTNKLPNRHRIDKTEHRRQELDRSYKQIYRQIVAQSTASATSNSSDSSSIKLEEFLSNTQHTSSFLQKSSKGMQSYGLRYNTRHATSAVEMEEVCCVQLGSYYWSEEYIGITANDIVFVKKKASSIYGANTSTIHIPFNQITDAYTLKGGACALNISDTQVFVISTFSKQYTVMVRSSADVWVHRIKSVIQTYNVYDTCSILAQIPYKHILRPKGWVLGDRLILNARSFHIKNIGITKSSDYCYHLSTLSVAILIETLLQLMLSLSDEFQNSVDDYSCSSSMNTHMYNKWVDYMDGVSLLQAVSYHRILELSEKEKMCVFLNLYHCLLLHSFVVYPKPKTATDWNSFYNSYSYEAFGDIFTLAELEHNIIRGSMHSPNIGVVTSYIAYLPTSKYIFTVKRNDARLVWAINCGSVSCIHKAPIYRASIMDRQLFAVVRASLLKQVEVNESTHTVTLPIQCEWYKKDITKDVDPSKKNKLLFALLPYLPSDVENFITAYYESSSSSSSKIHIKYRMFSFECQFIELLSDTDEEYYD